MKKFIFTSLILTIPFLCRAADDEVGRWHDAVEKYRVDEGIDDLAWLEELDVSDKQIEALPDNFDYSQLVELYLNDNLIRVFPSPIDFSLL